MRLSVAVLTSCALAYLLFLGPLFQLFQGWPIGGKVVHRSMMPVGRVVAVAADCRNKEAAYWVAKHISYDRSLEDVSTALTGLDPYRSTHFKNPQA